MVEYELKYKVDVFPKMPPIFIKSNEIQITDTYYDNEQYDLVHKGIFIRERGKYIEIKYLISSVDNSMCNEFKVKQSEFKIKNKLLKELLGNLNMSFFRDGFQEFLQDNGLKILLCIDKKRIEYRSKMITVCLDEVVNLGKFVEFETVSEDTKSILDLKAIIENLANNILDGKYYQEKTGYVELYLKKYNRIAYKRCLFKG